MFVLYNRVKVTNVGSRKHVLPIILLLLFSSDPKPTTKELSKRTKTVDVLRAHAYEDDSIKEAPCIIAKAVRSEGTSSSQ